METPTKAEYGTGILAGMRIPIIDPVSESQLARFQPKITSGDYTRDSDDLISVWVQSNWQGGGQAFLVNADSQNERWWDATLDTEAPNMLALRTKTYAMTPPAGVTGNFYPLVDYRETFYGVWGTSLCRLNGAVWEVVEDGGAIPLSLNGTPNERGQVYKDKLYIPLGSNGLDVFDATALSITNVEDAGPDPVPTLSAVVWDNKLAVLTTDGQYRTFDGTTWLAISDNYTVSDGSTPRKLVYFVDKAGDPTVYIVTSRGAWGVDPVNNKLVRIGGDYPPHPTQARAACVWRSETMYISVGPGVHEWNTEIFSPMGLDRNQGLRSELRGHIVDMMPEYNGMLVLVQGQAAEGDGNVLHLQGPLYQDEALEFPAQRTVSSLWRYNGFGWHKVWESPGATGAPSWSSLTAAEDGSRYGIFWGYGGTCYWHPLRINFYNPQQGVRAGIDSFEATGWLRTGRWNANMPAWPKLCSHIDVNPVDEFMGTVTIEYMTDRTLDANGIPTWVTMGQVTTNEQTRFYFGDNFVDSNGVTWATKTGIVFDWIEFRYTFDQWVDPDDADNDHTTPLIDSFIMKFIKLPLETASWQLDVPIDFDEEYYDVGPVEMKEFLSSLAASQSFVPFLFRDQLYRVVVAQSQTSLFSGENPHSRIQLIILQVG